MKHGILIRIAASSCAKAEKVSTRSLGKDERGKGWLASGKYNQVIVDGDLDVVKNVLDLYEMATKAVTSAGFKSTAAFVVETTTAWVEKSI